MFPFSSCVCQQYNKWSIIEKNKHEDLECGELPELQLCSSQRHSENSQYLAPACGLATNSDQLFPQLCIEFPLVPDDGDSNGNLQVYVMPDLNAYPIPQRLSSNNASSESEEGVKSPYPVSLPLQSPDAMTYSRNSADCEHRLNLSKTYSSTTELSNLDCELILKAVNSDTKCRLLKIQRQKKFVRRRNSFIISNKIKVCNPDRYGLVDLSNQVLAQEYLDKFVSSWQFNIFRMDRFTGGQASLVRVAYKLFEIHDLINHFNIDKVVLTNFLFSIQEVYHSFNPYHNALHAADVAQAMHCFLLEDKIKSISQPIDVFGCIIAALCHDADHPGQNQIYLEKINHFFVSFYKHLSVLENHHIRITMSLLHKTSLLKDCVSRDEWLKLTSFINNLILATDIVHQKLYLGKLMNLIREQKPTQEFSLEDKTLIYQVALKCSDISNPCRCWPVTLGWATLVCEEFFLQGDVEKKQGLSVLPTHDRCMTTKADIQLSFIRFIVRPLVTQWRTLLRSRLLRCLDGHVDRNLSSWEIYKQLYSVSTTKILSTTVPTGLLPLPPSSLMSSAGTALGTPSTVVPVMATLTEESTMTSRCTSRQPSSSGSNGTGGQHPRRLSLPDEGYRLHQPATIITTIISPAAPPVAPHPTATIKINYRRGSLPPAPLLMQQQMCRPGGGGGGASRRRGSLPLNMRTSATSSIPIPSLWENPADEEARMCVPPSVYSSWGMAAGKKGASVPKTAARAPVCGNYERRGSAPLISWSRSGLGEVLGGAAGSSSLLPGAATGGPSLVLAAETGLVSTCSRERLLLEVYWMAAAAGVSSSVSSCNSLHGIGAGPTSAGGTGPGGGAGPPSSSNSSRNDSGGGGAVATH